MKTNFKFLALALSGTLFLSPAYSAEAEPHSGNMNSEMSNSDAATATKMEMSNKPMSNDAQMGTTENSMGNMDMGKSDMDKSDMNKSDMNASGMNKTDMPKSTMSETDMTGFSRGSVARSIFTTLVDNREPVDKVKQVPDQTSDVFYFTELRDMEGQTAKHRWEYKGKVVAEVKFNVRGPRWRVWSKKSFTPGWSGDWKVSVVNGADEIISEEIIAFNEPTHDVIESEDMQGTTKGDAMEKTTMPHSESSSQQPMLN